MSLELFVSNISKTYCSDVILKNTSFTFDKSGIYVLMGPNGSGKSTFLRICALLEKPDSGKVNFYSEGNPITKDISLMRRITLLLPKIGVFNTTVYKNVSYGLHIRNRERSNIESKVEDVLDFVGLLQKKHQKSRQDERKTLIQTERPPGRREMAAVLVQSQSLVLSEGRQRVARSDPLPC